MGIGSEISDFRANLYCFLTSCSSSRNRLCILIGFLKVFRDDFDKFIQKFQMKMTPVANKMNAVEQGYQKLFFCMKSYVEQTEYEHAYRSPGITTFSKEAIASAGVVKVSLVP